MRRVLPDSAEAITAKVGDVQPELIPAGSFMGWLMYELEFEETTARAVVGRVWSCLFETGPNFFEKLEDLELSWSYRQKLHTGPRKYAAYPLGKHGRVFYAAEIR